MPQPDYTWFMAYRDLMAARADDITRGQKLFQQQEAKIAELKKTEEALRNEIGYLRKYHR